MKGRGLAGFGGWGKEKSEMRLGEGSLVRGMVVFRLRVKGKWR
jgi:hypothetical protein